MIVTMVASRIRPQGFALAPGSVVGSTVLSYGFRYRCGGSQYTLPMALDVHQGISLGSIQCYPKLS